MATGVRNILMIFLILSSIQLINTQTNLIPNPDFEITEDYCFGDNNDSMNMNSSSGFQYLRYWLPKLFYLFYWDTYQDTFFHPSLYEINAYGTPDFFHECSSPKSKSLSNNIAGFQIPFNGIGYAGIGIALGHYGSPIDYYREFARVQLKDTLKRGQGYCFQYRYSLSDINGRAASHLGAVFSVDSFYLGNNNVEISRKPQVYADYIMCKDLDTATWKLFEGSFVAEGGERWLTLGWFHHLDSIKYIVTNFYNPSPYYEEIWAYYYIDALELIECPQYGVPDYEIIPPNVISPNGDGLNDAFYIHPYLPQPSSLIIYNRWGAEVFRSANYDQTWQGTTTDGKPVAEGTYFYVLQLPSGTVKKGTVSVFR